MLKRCSALVLLACAAAAALADAPPSTRPAAAWSDRPVESIQFAASQGRDSLVWFSGSGWNAESDAVEPALKSSDFSEKTSVRFALVRVDFPAGREGENAKAFDPALTQLAERLGVAKLPALVAVDAQGRPFATTRPSGDAAACLVEIDALSATKASRDAAFADAAKLAGPARAAALARGLSFVEPYVRDHYTAVAAELVALDPSDTLGLKQKYSPVLSEARIDKVVQGEVYPMLDKGKFVEAIARLDALMAEATPTPDQRQLLMAFKAQVAFSNGDPAKAVRWLDEAYALNPKSDVAGRVAKAKAQIVEDAAPLAN